MNEIMAVSSKKIQEITKYEVPKEVSNKRKVSAGYWEILKNNHPGEDERVSCIMQIHNAHKTWSIDEVFDYVCKHNEWNDFNPEFTKEKINYVWEYTKKENPIKQKTKEENKKSEDVPTNELVNFNKFQEIFETTHSHLPAYNLVDSELGLIGKEYYSIKKYGSYKVEAMRQNAIQVKVGKENFDNRTHEVVIAGAGKGKGSYKKIIKQHINTADIHSARTHLEQLIGKIMGKGEKAYESEGFFRRKVLIADESNQLLCEEGTNMPNIMHEYRHAMDMYGYNQVEKKNVETEPLAFCPETNFTFLTHDLIFPPKFFDSGTSRRVFTFELKPKKVMEDTAFANLLAEAHEEELKQYINTPNKINRLEFSKEAIEEMIEFIKAWNNFTILHPNQRIRVLGERYFFHIKNYFFRMVSILSATKNETEVSVKTARQGCFDCVQFLLETFQIYANKSQITLSRDTWKTDDIEEARFFEWLWFNNATSREETKISIAEAQEKIEEVFGVFHRQAQNKYGDMKSRGLINDKKYKTESKCWLAFKPSDESGLVDFAGAEHIDLFKFLKQKRESLWL